LRSSAHLVPFLILGLLVLSACSSQTGTSSQPAAIDKAPTSRSGAAPKPTAPVYLLQGKATYSVAGYSVSVDYVGDVAELARAAKVANSEAPGNVALEGQSTFKLVVTNTTPGGHDVGFSEAQYGYSVDALSSGPFTLEGIFPSGSSACSLADPNPNPFADGESMTGTAVSAAELNGGCDFVYAYAFFGGAGSWPNNATLGADQSATLSGFGTVQPIERYNTIYAQNNQKQFGPLVLGDVPAASASSIANVLANPQALIIVYDGTLTGPRGSNPAPASCKILASSSPNFHC
jgi:hypothetical protein